MRPVPLTVVDHPLAAHLLTALRDRTTAPPVFRTLTKRLTLALVLEAVRQIRGTSTNQVEGCAATLVTGASGVATSALVLRAA